MFILAAGGTHGFNLGDVFFQLSMFFVLITIVIVIFSVIKSHFTQGKHLKGIEEKLDKLLEEKEKRNS
ncbi:hypothetical protein [Bacillus solimangrovi]|uniref:DUF4083 domain-containing protein n=1 Tax=Bacillus solimangrovi TaxID=1305675 RepID=A0A1E5LEL3_9BACI|nr:hypothetical protein [Bacillus solimangrovi]OEH92518.1 hypothetical protein BFG57_15385 [Bacillus solimangrovi]